MSQAKKSALVTGASKGIGYAVAKALLEVGYNVTITSRNLEEVEQAALQLQTQGLGQVQGIVSDVRNPQAVEQMIEAHLERFGGLDVLFVNAGVGRFANIEDLSLEQWHEIIDTNLNGAFYTVKAAIPALKKSQGYIFTLSSLAGRNTFAGAAAYNASKFGLNALSEVLNLDLRQYGIKVTQIMPGSVSTYFNHHEPDTQHDAWKIQPEDIAQLTIDLLNMPKRTLPSRIEVRPSQPPQK